MKKTLLSALSIITISFASMAQIIGPDVQVTEIIEPTSSITTIAGNSTVDVNFTFEVVADTLHTGDSSLVFSVSLDGATPVGFYIPITQDITSGSGLLSLQTPLSYSTTDMSSGEVDLCVTFLGFINGVGLPTPDANLANNQVCKTVNTPEPAAIEEINLVTSLFISDNQLVYDVKTHEAISFAVYNTSGQLVITETSNNTSGSINFSDLSNGVYFVNVQTGDEVFTKKIAKF